MPSGCLLVVAPDPELRDSLVFALEAEGFSVSAEASIDKLSRLADPCLDCAVLDQKAMARLPDQGLEEQRFACPVVLLEADPKGWHGPCVSEIVEMPLNGDAVAASVRRVLSPRSINPAQPPRR